MNTKTLSSKTIFTSSSFFSNSNISSIWILNSGESSAFNEVAIPKISDFKLFSTLARSSLSSAKRRTPLNYLCFYFILNKSRCWSFTVSISLFVSLFVLKTSSPCLLTYLRKFNMVCFQSHCDSSQFLPSSIGQCPVAFIMFKIGSLPRSFTFSVSQKYQWNDNYQLICVRSRLNYWNPCSYWKESLLAYEALDRLPMLASLIMLTNILLILSPSMRWCQLLTFHPECVALPKTSHTRIHRSHRTDQLRFSSVGLLLHSNERSLKLSSGLS